MVNPMAYDCFFCVLGSAVSVEAPVHSAVLLVHKVVEDIFLCTQSCVQVAMVAEHTVGSSERPKDACVEDGTLFGISHDMVVAVNASVEASALTVNHAVKPEVQYVVGETLVHLILHFLCCHCYKIPPF